MSDKNHEQYLEQIETAVAETTKSLLAAAEEDNQPTPKNFRKMARMVAEKQVEIDRLKEYQSNDKKTIRQLRAHFKEAVDEATELKEENKKLAEIDHQLYSVRRDAELREITGLEDISELEDFVAELKELNSERENASYQLAGELEDINTRWAEDKEADRIEIEKLKDEIECRHSTWESMEGEYQGEIEELKKARDYWSKSYHLIGEKWSKDITEAQEDATAPLEKEINKLKSQITKLQASEAKLDQSTVGSMLSTTLADLS
jgi:uncharacterized phage infection (PIP) family protein YhgE